MNILHEKRKLLPMGHAMGGLMGGGGGGGTTSTSYQTNIPEYARPYVDTMLGATQNQLFTTQKTGGTPTYDSEGNQIGTTGGTTEITGFQPYRAFGGTYDEDKSSPTYGKQLTYDPSKSVAGFTDLQTGAQQAARDIRMPGQFGDATTAANQGIQQALNASQYQPYAFGNQYQAPPSYSTGIFGVQDVNAPNLSQYQMGPAERVRTQSFARPGSAEAYMSPYMQGVVDIQQREARRASDIARQGQQAQAVGAGAFGGSRQALVEAERQRNLATQLGDIQSAGLQSAYGQAQQQFNVEQQARLAAQQANQQAGITVGGQNLQALLGTQQLGAGQNLQAQLANQQAGMQAQQLAEQSRQYGYGQNMTAAQLAAQYGLAGQQATEQSRQFGANLGLQGAQTGIQGASQLAGIGGQQLAAQQGIIGLQNQMGAQRQAYDQQVINQAIQDYANAQQYPLMQLGTMSNMLRGLPMQAQTTNQYVAQPNAITQGIGAMGTYGALKGAGVFAEGGEVKSMAAGGITSVPRYDIGGEVASQLENMDPQELERHAKESSSPTIRRMAAKLLREKQMAQAPQGVGPVGPMGVDYQAAPVRAAAGGILAFYAGGNKKDAEERDYSVLSDADFPTEPQKEIETSDARLSSTPRTGIGPVLSRAGEAIGRGVDVARQGIRSAVERPKLEGMRFDREDKTTPDIVPVGYEKKPATSTKPELQTAEGAASRTPAQKAEQARLAAIYAAQRAAPAKGEQQATASVTRPAAPAEGPAAAPAAARAQGVAQVAAPAAEAYDPLANINKAITAAEKEANLSDEDYLKRVKANVPENQAVAEYRKSIMDERANSVDEAKRQRYMRMAEFFSRWGTTPGSVLTAGLSAMQKTLPDLITDERELKKAKRELDKAQYDIDNATRLEELGYIKDARALKEKTADRLKDLTHYRINAETQLATTKMTRDSAERVARTQAAVSAESSRTSRELAADDKAYRTIFVAQDKVKDIMSGLDKYKTSDEYKNATRAIDAYNKQVKEKGEENVEKGVRSRFESAREKLYGKKGALTMWESQLDEAKQDVRDARDRYTQKGGKAPTQKSKGEPTVSNWG